MPVVTCVGNCVADVVARPVDRLPERGTLAAVERIGLFAGGCGANTATGLAKLGIETALIGKIGADGFGDFLAAELTKAGVDTCGLRRDITAATSATIVIGHADGERSFLHDAGANATLTLDEIDLETVRHSKILAVAGVFLMPALDGLPMAELLKKAQAAGIVTVLDTAWDPAGRWLDLLAPCLPHLDYFLPSLDEAVMLTGGLHGPEAIADFFLARGVGTVGLKLGGQGCYLKSRSGSAHPVPALPAEVRDTLGAGNSFVAGFTAALSKGWTLLQCGQFACAVGSCVVASIGATTGIKSFAETQAIMEDFYPRNDTKGHE